LDIFGLLGGLGDWLVNPSKNSRAQAPEQDLAHILLVPRPKHIFKIKPTTPPPPS